MSVINTNYLALVSQGNLTKSQNALGTAIERLSSGLRINSAKDDAAGQAIANRFTANIRGLTQAARNANDGISIAQTTEGALNEINNNLQRIRELTVQAANGSNSQSDLDSIQDEINQRLDEIDRVSRESQFNGRTILGDDAKGLTIQVGANDNQTINIGLRAINRESLGLEGFNVNGKGSIPNEVATVDDLTLAGFEPVSGTNRWELETKLDNTEVSAANALAKLADGGVATFAGSNNAYGTAADGHSYTYNADTQTFTYNVSNVAAANVASAITPGAGEESVSASIEIGGKSIDVLITNTGDITTASGKALYIDSAGNLTETTSGNPNTYANATVENLTTLMDDSVAGTPTIKSADGTVDLEIGPDIGIDIASAIITLADGTTLTGNGGGPGTSINVVGAKVTAAQLLNMEAADATTGLTFDAVVDGASATVTISTTAGVTTVKEGSDTVYTDADGNLTTDDHRVETTIYYAQENGNITNNSGERIYADGKGGFTTNDASASERTDNPLKRLDDALADVDKLRSELGAVQNRFQSTIANLANTVNNLSAARSRIEDADYAVEVSNMTRAQILQQAGTSVLAQANQVPQTVLSLLR